VLVGTRVIPAAHNTHASITPAIAINFVHWSLLNNSGPNNLRPWSAAEEVLWRLWMIIEMRTYKTKPGKRSQFLELFRSKSIPAHTEIGMKILGPFLSVEDPNTFFFMRGFPDLLSREPMKAKFYEGELWKSELENVLLPMLENYEVVVVEDADGLVHW
jgi:NIPSNAP